MYRQQRGGLELTLLFLLASSQSLTLRAVDGLYFLNRWVLCNAKLRGCSPCGAYVQRCKWRLPADVALNSVTQRAPLLELRPDQRWVGEPPT